MFSSLCQHRRNPVFLASAFTDQILDLQPCSFGQRFGVLPHCLAQRLRELSKLEAAQIAFV